MENLSMDLLLNPVNPFEQPSDPPKEGEEGGLQKGTQNAQTEENTEGKSPEGVGGRDTVHETGTFTSIADALYKDGILDSVSEEDVKTVKTADDLQALFKKHLEKQLTEKQQRIDKALTNGVEPDVIKSYEGTLEYLDTLSEDVLKQETAEAETARKNLIYQDFINRGFSKERAVKEVEKSISAGTDITDAIEALESNKSYFKSSYGKILKEKEDAKNEQIKAFAKFQEDLKTKILDTEEPIEGIKLSKSERDGILKSISKKDLSEYAQKNPVEYQRNLYTLFYLTDGFKNLNKITKEIGQRVTQTALSNLEKTITTPSGSPFGDDSKTTIEEWNPFMKS